MQIGKKIAYIRILKGIKQQSLAKELGISQQAVSKLESSERIDDEKLEHVAEILGVTAGTIRNLREITEILEAINPSDGTSFRFDSDIDNRIFQLFEAYKELYEIVLESERARIKTLEELVKTLSEKNKE